MGADQHNLSFGSAGCDSVTMPESTLLEAECLFLSPRIEHMNKITDIGTFCNYARDTLNELQSINDQECVRLQLEHKRLKGEAKAARETHARATTELVKKNNEKANHRANLASQNSMMRSLESAINQARAEIGGLRDKIRSEEERRRNAALDLIPFHGLISGIISGDMKRAIPYYSQIDGIISAVEKDLEAAEARVQREQNNISQLSQQSNETKRALENTMRVIARLEAESAKSQKQIEKCDHDTKIIGQKITKLHKTRMNLEALGLEYAFLQCDVELARDTDEPFLIDQCVAGFRLLMASP